MSASPARGPSGRPRVGIDASTLAVRGKGVSRYVSELLPALARLEGPFELVALADPEVGLPQGAEELERHPIRARPASRWEQVGLPRAVRAARLDLVHTVSDRLPLAPTAPIVVYLFEDPRYRSELSRGARSARHAAADLLTGVLFPISLRRAALVLASSEATVRDLRRRGVPDERLRLIYPGVSEGFRPARDDGELRAIREQLGYPGGFVLHFSSDDPRDNSDVALDAYAEAAGRRPELPPLVIAGPVDGRLDPQRERARRLGIDGRVAWAGYQSGEALLRLYRAAAAYLDPSLFEGFGFQVAEALASGVPVVCSSTSSLPEVVSDAGILRAPDDVRGFAEALVAVLSDPELAGRLASRAAARGASFRWEKTAAETLAAWLTFFPKLAG